ncbi:MAG TPA: hypothetical protein VIR58_02725 [Acidimicrobiales bacterium]
MSGRLRGDGGQVGGIEAIPFGLLIFVIGSLLIVNAWGVVDAKFATDAAARQAARTFVEGEGLDGALSAAEEAALATISGHGRDPSRTTVDTVGSLAFERCARVTFEVSYEVPTISLPFIGGYGSGPFHVRSSHTELVDPYRSGVPGEAEGCP